MSDILTGSVLYVTAADDFKVYVCLFKSVKENVYVYVPFIYNKWGSFISL